ncbi:unnamed protein product, partial [Meganyctiphanes norvegica]
QILKNGCGLQDRCCLQITTAIKVDKLKKNVTTDEELQTLVDELNRIFNPQITSNEMVEGRKISSNEFLGFTNGLIQTTSHILDVTDNSKNGLSKPSSSSINTFDVNTFDVKTEVKNYLQQWFINSFIKNLDNKTADDKLDNNSVRIVTYEELGPFLRGVELVLDIGVQIGIFVVLGGLMGIVLGGYSGFAFESCLTCTIMDILYQLELF